CDEPEAYVSWDTISPPVKITLEESRIIGEYVTNLEFWGSEIINIFLTLEKKDRSIDLQTEIFGRNL
ncbi:unnamed protein product, partial [marine sediment metagenome]